MSKRRTLPEQLVADALRAFPEYEVREQVRFGPYLADFVLGWRLVLEVDGEAFHEPARDQRRDAYLARRALEVARLPSKEVLALSPLGLIERLDQVLRQYEHVARHP